MKFPSQYLFAPFMSLIFASSFAVAMPDVGDYVKFTKIYQVSADEFHTIKYSAELLSYDADTDDFQVKITEAYEDGSVQEYPNTWAKSLLTTDDEIDTLLKDCVNLGGTREDIQVGSESLPSCRMEEANEGETFIDWYAHVPFGRIRYEVNQRFGVRMTSTLTDYHLKLRHP